MELRISPTRTTNLRLPGGPDGAGLLVGGPSLRSGGPLFNGGGPLDDAPLKKGSTFLRYHGNPSQDKQNWKNYMSSGLLREQNQINWDHCQWCHHSITRYLRFRRAKWTYLCWVGPSFHLALLWIRESLLVNRGFVDAKMVDHGVQQIQTEASLLALLLLTYHLESEQQNSR